MPSNSYGNQLRGVPWQSQRVKWCVAISGAGFTTTHHQEFGLPQQAGRPEPGVLHIRFDTLLIPSVARCREPV